MASRRSRLKAVANLPIRRKPLTVQQTAEESKIQDDPSLQSALSDNEQENERESLKKQAESREDDGNSTGDSEPSPMCGTPSSNRDQLQNGGTSAEDPVSVEEVISKIGSNSSSATGSRFGRRVKPVVSLAVLKERPHRIETQKMVIGDSEPIGKENQCITPDHDNSSFTDGKKNTENLDLRDQRVTNGNDTEIAQNDKTILSSKQPSEKLCNDSLYQEQVVKQMSQGHHNEPEDTYQKHSEQFQQLNLKSPVNSSKNIVTVSGTNSVDNSNIINNKHTQDVITKLRTEVLSHSNKNFSDSLIHHTSSQSNVHLQYGSINSKRNFLKPKKLKFNDYTRKVADARREFQRKYEKIPPDRSSLRMIDLIFYNPSTNPMESKTKSEKRDTHIQDSDLLNESRVDDPDPIDKSSDLVNDEDGGDGGVDEFGKMPVPQVKIGSNGEIILDEKSLIIETTGAKKGREDLQNSVPVFEDKSSKTCYYKRKTHKSRDWSDLETKRFYKALNTIGTDFSLMQKYFPIRSRLELKNKFKREEKLNRSLVDKALNNPSEFDIIQFEKYLAMEKKAEEEEMESRIQRKMRTKKHENRVRTKTSILAREVTESDEDDSMEPSTVDRIKIKQNEKLKKSNDISLLCEKYLLKEVNDSSGGISDRNSSKLFAVDGVGSTDKIRGAFNEIQNSCGEQKLEVCTEPLSDNAVDEFYDAVLSLSASLKPGAKDPKAKKKSKPLTAEKRKASQPARKYGKKQKTYPFVSTLDIEAYDSRCDSNSSSNESNDNSFTSTKTITDQDFIKYLTDNAKNLKESKIQVQITGDCSSEENVEIILDNVPSITINEVADYNVTVAEDGLLDGQERNAPQGKETSVIVRNPNAKNSAELCGLTTEEESNVDDFVTLQNGYSKFPDTENGGQIAENENFILVIGENVDSIANITII